MLGDNMTLRTIAMAQIATHLGDVDANLALHLELIEQAKSQRAELVVFPELSLTGYGFVEAETRHRFYIAAAYLSNGKVLHIHRKVYLPTYGLFDEGRFFAWGDQVRAFDSRFGRIGMLICEDFWHASPPYLLWLDGAEIMFLISASPGRGISGDERLESARWVERINHAWSPLDG
jgi:predicted amidohydrolase